MVGSSWASACSTSQSAIDNAISGDMVWITASTYHPGIAPTESIVLKEGVDVYGGFSGAEGSLSERDVLVALSSEKKYLIVCTLKSIIIT